LFPHCSRIAPAASRQEAGNNKIIDNNDKVKYSMQRLQLMWGDPEAKP
jgi:hypothetical protein